MGRTVRAAVAYAAHRGTFNLRAGRRIEWEAPRTFDHLGSFEFCPVILGEPAIGIAMRRGQMHEDFLEVLSLVKLRDRLSASDGGQLMVRLLAGTFLRPQTQLDANV